MIQKVNLRDSYRFYKANESNPVDIKTYLYIVTGFIAFMMRKVFEGFFVQLSGGKSMGTIGIRGKKITPTIDEEGNIKGLAVDWKLTKELWKTNPEAEVNKQFIYHTNEHSNGIRYKFVWYKTGMKVGNKMLYSLTFSKPNKRKLAKLIREGAEYLVLPS